MARHSRSSPSSPRTVRLTAFWLAAMIVPAIAAEAHGAPPCHPVRGFYEERAVAPTRCPSPVELCIEGEFSGGVKGVFASTATAFQVNPDTATTTVVWFTGEGVTHARVHGKQGDILFKSAGAFQTTGDGHIVDLQTITGGTGELAGITGVIRASGVFNSTTGIGESAYEGTVCFP